MRTALLLPTLALTASLGARPAPDEGMWAFQAIPTAALKARHGWAPDGPWLHQLRRSAVKFPGGSGAFVSRDGLVLTNQHVARRWIERAGTPERDLLAQGFVARDRASEVPLPGLVLQVLELMVDVTTEVNRATAAAPPEARLQARRVAFARLRKFHQERTGLACEQVVFHRGGQSWIYGYRRFSDVRLVMVPEAQMAYFGGDPDNFTFPRFALDMCLLRVYHRGQPWCPPHFIPWSREGARRGDLTLVAGHPGRTLRQDTLSQMRFSRDVVLPWAIKYKQFITEALTAHAAVSEEAARSVRVPLQSAQNSLKRHQAWLKGLRDEAAMARIAADERRLRQRLMKLPDPPRGSHGAITRALRAYRGRHVETQLVSTGESTLLDWALQLVRLGDELRRPSEERLPDYQDAYLPDLRGRLAQATPTDPALEAACLRMHRDLLRRELGPRHPYTRLWKEPDLAELVAQSRLADPAFRRDLLARGPAALRNCKDPLMEFARRLDPSFRDLRAWMDHAVFAPFTEHLSRLARARFEVDPGIYPDANGTLRLSFGPLAGPLRQGREQPAFTTFLGLYDRADGWAGRPRATNPWALPGRWVAKRPLLDPATPLNFVHAVDAVGGSSGSPVVDTRGHLVGLLFDGNLASLTGNYYYDGRSNRAISVDVRAMREALAKVYDAGHLLDELDLPPRETPPPDPLSLPQ